MKIELKPLEGITIEGVGDVLLGQSRLAIFNLLGRPSSHSNNNESLYNAYELRIDFDENGVSFIEFIYGPNPERTELLLYGIDPFKVGADNLVQLLTLKNDGAVDYSEAAYAYCFLNISVGVWRQATEQDIQLSIDEAKFDGTANDLILQLEDELESVKNFWTIGIGRKGYYDDIQN